MDVSHRRRLLTIPPFVEARRAKGKRRKKEGKKKERERNWIYVACSLIKTRSRRMDRAISRINSMRVRLEVENQIGLPENKKLVSKRRI